MQIVEKDPLQPSGPPQTSLVEIGPRFVLTPIRIFEGAFNGATVYSNPGTIIPWSLVFADYRLTPFIQSTSHRLLYVKHSETPRAPSIRRGRLWSTNEQQGRRIKNWRRTSWLFAKCLHSREIRLPSTNATFIVANVISISWTLCRHGLSYVASRMAYSQVMVKISKVTDTMRSRWSAEQVPFRRSAQYC